MRTIQAPLLMLIAAMALPASASAAASSTVFDLQLNAPFDVPECAYQIVNVPIGRQGILVKRTAQMYQYLEERPASGRCFKREGMGYTAPAMDADGKALPLPAAGPVSNGDVRIIYAESAKPGLVGDKWIWVRVEDSTLKSVKFYFPSSNIKEVEQALGKKYGEPTAVDEMYEDRYREGRKDYYIARWRLADLTVVLTSVDTSLDYDGPRYSVGHVRVLYGAQPAAVDHNPL